MVEAGADSERASAQAAFGGIAALLSREPGYSVAAKCLEVQAAAERADPTLRTADRVRLAPEAWSWYVGACGEREVGSLLRALGPEWMVRHAVPIGTGTQDVDHLVIGPGGIFAINTKHHRDASIWVGDHVLRVNNANTHHIAQARKDAENAARRLGARAGFPVSVTSVIALVGERSMVDGRQGPRDHPAVVSSRQLVEWLRRQAPKQSPSELGLARLAAEEPGTWHVDPRAAETLRVMRRFDRLVSEVGAAPQPTPVSTMSSAPGTAARSARDSRTSFGGSAPASRPPRRLSKREQRRRERRAQDLAKLVLLVIGGLTFPIWLPVVTELFTTVVTAGVPRP